MPIDNKSSKRVKKQRPTGKTAPSATQVVDQPPADTERSAVRPLPKNAIKRVKELFSDIKRIENEPLPTVEPHAPQAVTDNVQTRSELESLRAQILELEAKLKANGQLASRQAKPDEQAAAQIVYEKERVGFVYSNDSVLPLPSTDFSPEKLENAIKAPLTAGSELIGEMDIQPPAEKKWTDEEEGLADAVARQVSLQIQNLRLLASAERARAEAQAATRRFAHDSWESFLDAIHQSEQVGFAYNQDAVAPYKDPTPTDADFQQTISVMEEHVGRVFLKTDPARQLDEADKALIAAVTQQLGQQVENLRLLADASRARADAEEATRRLSHESWQAYIGRQKKDTLAFAYDSNQVLPLKKNPKDVSFVEPLMVRGETIGELAVAGWENITQDKIDMAAAIATQTSTHLESLRLTEELQQRAYELAAVATISTTASTLLNPDELLQAVVDLTNERFGIYHAHVYLADEAWNTLLLAAGAGEVGRQMVAEQHAISMDAKQSLVARAAMERKAVISNDVRKEPGFLPNPRLPETRAEIAVPMIVGDKMLGVFDVQSDQVGRFSQEDANIYTTLATQVAVALQNARLYVEQAATVTQLRELDRLKSSFLANMSHELRTPLNSILGFADVILEGLDGPLTENMDNDLRLIQKNGQHLLHLINDVLDMAKIESGKMNLAIERFKLGEIIEEVTNITSPLASEKSLSLFMEPDSDSELEVSADRTRLRQVMINLINNAIKFTEKGKISIRVTREKDNARITVKDTGIGIPPEKIEDVFQEFTQVDTSTTRKVGGTGLGLPISRRLIEMHGGKLWAESTGVPGEGSTFIVLLPIEARLNPDMVK
jgi:signal transduction histidine kinase